MTDAHLGGLARELRQKGVDCETVHQAMLGHGGSSVKISDPEIVKFLRSQRGSLALITLDSELAEYCLKLEVPVVRVQDVILEHTRKLA